MGLQITKEIETNKGLTSEAYFRISGYSITKYAGVSLMIEVYNSKSEANSIATASQVASLAVKIPEIGENIYITPLDVQGLESQNIFAYGYGKLKEKLSALYGAENIIDC